MMKKDTLPQKPETYPDLWGLIWPLSVTVVLIWLAIWIIAYA